MVLALTSAKNVLNLFPPPQTPTQGEVWTVYRRADLSRAIALGVVLCSAAVATGGIVREFRAADRKNDNDLTAQAPLDMSRLLAERGDDRYQLRAFHSSRPQAEAADHIERTRRAE